MNRKFKVLLSRLVYGRRKNIRLGKDSYIGLGSQIYGTPVNMGDYNGAEHLYVIGSQPLTIGKYCAIAEYVVVVTSNHIMNKPNIQAKLQNEHFQDSMDDITKGPVIIGNNVWIGTRAIILPGVCIGDGAVIGAGSIVSKSVKPFAIVAGNPAKKIGQRFSDQTITRLLVDPWWEWDENKIKASRKYFITPQK